ncbi:thiamine phosphate synthase [Candidatus Contendibacter odensensis]|uniref:Thiamin phosphate synthase (Thiamin phosphate pyrophosphorylase) n=1 Tax=Candidatus Contendobacter odensis Run_B_J11 TaxID=1400861 RepID=A0A7U7J2C9_9GAMM|nr:thiamine phosphate synthase [Candidatus Contendobacter odensis]CDH43203.1 thiamin phosphate synthase (thiamin phosphate pyrophosphorylase) [Candidatus Contendobacter odensis Run_B_J11]
MKTAGIYGFYPVVDDVRWLRRFLPLGVRTIQLRIKQQSTAAVQRQLREALAIAADYDDCQMIINDYWREAIALGARWLHLGQGDLAGADRAAIQAAGIKLGISTHSFEELANALEAQPDHLALGPIYPTTLKQMPWSPQGLARIGEWKTRCSELPLVAIGGITLERAEAVLAAGADAIAVVSDVLSAPNPEDRVCAWLDLFREAATPAQIG